MVRFAFAIITFPLLSGCSMVVDTRCFEGECDTADAAVDVVVEAIASKPDASVDASPDVVKDAGLPDVPPADANDVCMSFTMDPCRNVTGGGCYCNASTQAGFDSAHAIPNCIYHCNGAATEKTDRAQLCGGGCNVASSGTEDYCKGDQPCTASVAQCFNSCGE